MTWLFTTWTRYARVPIFPKARREGLALGTDANLTLAPYRRPSADDPCIWETVKRLACLCVQAAFVCDVFQESVFRLDYIIAYLSSSRISFAQTTTNSLLFFPATAQYTPGRILSLLLAITSTVVSEATLTRTVSLLALGMYHVWYNHRDGCLPRTTYMQNHFPALLRFGYVFSTNDKMIPRLFLHLKSFMYQIHYFPCHHMI